MTSRPSTAAPILAVLAIVAALFGAYVAGYFQLSEQTSVLKFKDTWVRRSFSNRWLARAYWPAAKCEAWLSGWDVQADTVDDPKPALLKYGLVGQD